MARIAGINIPNHQHTEIGLTAIFGIGRPRARKICVSAGVPVSKKVKDLDDSEMERLRDEVGKFIVEGDLRREVLDEHQATDGPGLLSRSASSSWFAGPWSAHAYQRAHPQGTA